MRIFFLKSHWSNGKNHKLLITKYLMADRRVSNKKTITKKEVGSLKE
jgi:hypothetical protein